MAINCDNCLREPCEKDCIQDPEKLKADLMQALGVKQPEDRTGFLISKRKMIRIK